jgi:hypothetical protein
MYLDAAHDTTIPPWVPAVFAKSTLQAKPKSGKVLADSNVTRISF